MSLSKIYSFASRGRPMLNVCALTDISLDLLDLYWQRRKIFSLARCLVFNLFVDHYCGRQEEPADCSWFWGQNNIHWEVQRGSQKMDDKNIPSIYQISQNDISIQRYQSVWPGWKELTNPLQLCWIWNQKNIYAQRE